MKRWGLPCSLAFVVFLIAAKGYCSPTFEAGLSGHSAEKGHTFQIYVVIHSTEPLKNVQVSVMEPEGFYAQALASSGVAVGGSESGAAHNTARIEHLGRNSSITAAFKVWAPGLDGNPSKGKKESLYSTREPKLFPINVLYSSQFAEGYETGAYTTQVTIRYTTSIGHYLVAGLLGIVLGFVAKMATQYKNEIAEAVKAKGTVLEKTGMFFFQSLVVRLPLLLTLLIIGFGVLIFLAKDSLPVTSWDQAVALGLGTGLLGDEQLITKIKKLAG